MKSGEHADFSRLVLEFESPAAWQLGRIEGGYALRLTAPVPEFDLSGVFDFMPKTRVEDVVETAQGLQFVVRCECHADAFDYRPGILVIDIKDGPAPASARFEERFAEDLAGGTARGAADDPTPVPAPRPPQFRATAPAVGRADVARSRAPDFGLGLSLGSGGASSALPISPVSLPSPDQSVARQALVEGFARAMSQGLLTPTATGGEVLPDGTTTSEQPVGFTLRLGTDLPGNPEVPVSAEKCDPANAYDLARLSENETPGSMISLANTFLAEAPPGEETQSSVSAARLYLRLGFGAEAQAALRVYGAESEEAEILAEIAGIIDAPGEASAPILELRASCPNAAALWALLSGAADLEDLDIQAAEAAFSALPGDLRRHLGPAVSQAFRARGADDAATLSRKAVTRLPTPVPPALRLEEEVVIAEETSEGETPPVASTNAEDPTDPLLATERMTLRLAADLRRQSQVPTSVLDEASALLHETRGAPQSDALLQVMAGVLGAANRPREGIAMLEAIAGSTYAESYDLGAAQGTLLEALADLTSDGAFLSYVIPRGPEGFPSALTFKQAEHLSTRLSDLGFSTEAARFVADFGDEPSGLGDATRNLFLASAAIEAGRPDEALARLATDDSPAAMALRAQALRDVAAYDAAAQLFARSGNVQAAAEAAWMAGDYPQASALLPEGPRNAVANLLRPETDGPDPQADQLPPADSLEGLPSSGPGSVGPAVDTPPGDPPPATDTGGSSTAVNGRAIPIPVQPQPLASGRDLLRRSAEARDLVEALLSADGLGEVQ